MQAFQALFPISDRVGGRDDSKRCCCTRIELEIDCCKLLCLLPMVCRLNGVVVENVAKMQNS